MNPATPTAPFHFDLPDAVPPFSGAALKTPEIADALAYCRKLEAIVAPLGWHVAPLGWHVALTGGTLYKDGPRKDVDVALYRNDARNPAASKSPQEVVETLEAERAFYGSFRRSDRPAQTDAEYHDKLCYVGRSARKGEPGAFRVDLFFL